MPVRHERGGRARKGFAGAGRMRFGHRVTREGGRCGWNRGVDGERETRGPRTAPFGDVDRRRLGLPPPIIRRERLTYRSMRTFRGVSPGRDRNGAMTFGSSSPPAGTWAPLMGRESETPLPFCEN